MHQRAEELDVAAHLTRGEIWVAQLHGVKKRSMHLRNHAQIPVRFDDAEERAELHSERVPHLEQDCIARGLDDDLVELCHGSSVRGRRCLPRPGA